MKNIDADNELIPYMLVEHQAPWLIPSSRTIFFNEAVINFEDIVQFKQSEVETRQKQLRLESVNEQLNDLVAGQTEQIGQLASEVLLAGHKVRTAVSNLLHDDLQQILVSMKLKILAIEQLQSIDEDILHGQLLELFEATNLAIAVTRQVASDLKPPILSNKDFMALIQWLVKVMNRQYGLVVEVKGSVRPSWLMEEVSSFLFQTIRELLFNVVKHAGVNEVLVEVSEASDRLSIAVSDSGEGFDTAITMQQPSSLGLFNIRRQLELFGGQFQIESQPGLGTRAVVVVRR
jgi:signal transduction histidine kinase